MALETKWNKTWYSEKSIDTVLVPNTQFYRGRYDLKENLLLMNKETVIRFIRNTDLYTGDPTGNSIHIIEQGEHLRPDVVAYKMYGNPNLAWVLLAANNMKSIFEFTVTKEIIVPEITQLYSTNGVLSR